MAALRERRRPLQPSWLCNAQRLRASGPKRSIQLRAACGSEGAGQQRSRRADKDADKTRCSSSTLWTLRSRNHSNKHAPDRIHKNHVRRHITRDDILSPPATPQTWACGACSVVQAMLVKLVAQPRRKNAARQRERQGAGRLARGWATRQPGPRGQLRRGGGPRSAGRRRACARRPSGRGG